MLVKVLLVSACVLCLTSNGGYAKWDDLKVTFPAAVSVPRTKEEAKDANWTKIGNCSSNSKFRGARYVKDQDYSVILMFDIQGQIAGIQTGIPTGNASYPPPKQRDHMFQLSGHYYVLTAYFTHPRNICSNGRSEEQLQQEGTGNALYIQNGTNPEHDVVCVPLGQAEVARQSDRWTMGKCYQMMGMHFWYSLTEDMECEDFQPVFLLYNNTELQGFGWAMGLNLTSPRFEHPTFEYASAFMNSTPTCLKDYARLSTLHVYFTSDIQSIRCSK